MVEEQKMEQRAQAVKRLRSLFDMHNVSFGAPENLGGLLLSLHENRHFSMDFWSLVNTLSEDGSGTMSNEELLEATIEGATSVSSSALPEYERPGAHELRQMLAGVDTASPVTLPAPISQPSDALLPKQTFSATPAVASEPFNAEDALRTKISIGEALAKLEQSTRELREQLAQIDTQIDSQTIAPPSATTPEALGALSNKTETQSVVAESSPSQPSLFQPVRPSDQQADIDQQAETAARWSRADIAPESIKPSARFIAPSPEQPVPMAPVAPPAPRPTSSNFESDAFARRRPVHTFSQRGLAVPDLDDDPSIIAPLSNYAEESSSAGKWVIAFIVLAAVAAGGYMGARTDRGHAMLSTAIDFARDKYESLTGQTAPQQTITSTTPAPQPTQPTPAQPTTTQPATAATTETPVESSPATGSQPKLPPTPTTSGDVPATTAAPSSAAKQPELPTLRPAHKTDIAKAEPIEKPLVRPRPTGPIPDAGAVHVPGSTMAANLIVSRVPAYPEAAKAQEIEGSVIMDVLIAPNGSVTYVRPIDGDRLLQNAAEDAVMRWRYKPYLVNGVAVQVSTTVRVDFRLPR